MVEIIRRHEVLRTCFPMDAGRPVRRVLPNPGAFAAPVDLRGLPIDKREVVAQRLATEEMARPFKLQNDPPVRCSLLCLGEADHILLWTTHHIVFDGWSGEVLGRELAAIYGAFALGKPSPLSEPPLQYAQYAARQRERMRGERLEGALAFWREHMAGAPSVLELPTDLPRPATKTERGGRVTATFDASLVWGLKDLCGREKVTLFMTLLVAFQALLARTAGTRDIVVGCPVAGRDDPVLEELIGPFINTLPLRTVLDLSASFRALLRQSQPRVLEALGVPMSRLKSWSRSSGPSDRSDTARFFRFFFSSAIYPGTKRGFPS